MDIEEMKAGRGAPLARRLWTARLAAALFGLLLLGGCSRLMSIIDPSAF